MHTELLLFVILAFVFMFTEVTLNMRKRSKAGSSTQRSDRGSLAVIWIVIAISFTIGFNKAFNGNWRYMNYIFGAAGLILFISGMIIRWIAVIQLDKAFTVDVAVTAGQQLKTDGIYRLVRHPSYLGAFLIITGISFGMNSIFSFLVVTIPVFFAFAYRIHIEEKLLMASFGEKYLDYSERTSRMIPFIY
jgi:protein-S-isoprenylcysteine O-methyltransferase Ste14